KHHSLLHPRKTITEEQQQRENTHTHESKNITTHFIKHEPGQVLLATALVDVSQENGQTHVYRALLDQGSQASFVTEDFVKSSGLKRFKINDEVIGLGEESGLRMKNVVELRLRSRVDPHFTMSVKAYVLKSITNNLPSQICTITDWSELHTIALADPTFNVPNKIDMLLGAEVYSNVIDHGLLRSSTGTIAQKTKLGWVLSGNATATPSGRSYTRVVNADNTQLRELRHRGWERNQKKEKTQSGRVDINIPWWAVKNRVLGGRNVGVVSAPP
ncbi:PREDICTED: uncharacterized protein LOC106101771, partial [Papilio polytes]|uniref:uncharacterized protein LOC106101771 n=1 Tax=Papilio polytes TaxID=76194 RepID=UPI000675D2F5